MKKLQEDTIDKIFFLYRKGTFPKDIAPQLNISYDTVLKYLSKAYNL